MQLKEIYRYTGVLYGVNLVSSFITFLVMILITRAISKQDMGLYGMYQAYLLMCVYMSGFGVSSAIVKFVAQRHVPIEQIHTAVGRVLGLMLVVFLALGAILVANGKEILGLAILTLPAYHLLDFALSYSRGHFWRNAEWMILLGSSLTTSAMILVAMHWFPDHRGPIYGQLLGAYTTAAALAMVFFYSTRGQPRRFASIEGEWTKDFIKIALPVFIASALYAFNDVTERLIIEKYIGLEAVGEYVLAMALFNILDRPAGLLARVLLSYFSGNSAETDPKLHMAAVGRIIKINLLVLPTFALALITLLPVVLPWFLNKDYSRAFDILAIVSVIMVAKSFELVNSMLVIARNQPVMNIYAQLIAFSVFVPTAIGLVHVFGVFGVAGAVVLRWMVFATWQFWQMKRRLVLTLSERVFTRALAAYLIALSLFTKAPWSMVAVYLVVGTGLQLWTMQDFQKFSRLRQLWGK